MVLSVQGTAVKQLPPSRGLRSQKAVSAPGHHPAASQRRQGLHGPALWGESLWGPSSVPELQVTGLQKSRCKQCTEQIRFLSDDEKREPTTIPRARWRWHWLWLCVPSLASLGELPCYRNYLQGDKYSCKFRNCITSSRDCGTCLMVI